MQAQAQAQAQTQNKRRSGVFNPAELQAGGIAPTHQETPKPSETTMSRRERRGTINLGTEVLALPSFMKNQQAPALPETPTPKQPESPEKPAPSKAAPEPEPEPEEDDDDQEVCLY